MEDEISVGAKTPRSLSGNLAEHGIFFLNSMGATEILLLEAEWDCGREG